MALAAKIIPPISVKKNVLKPLKRTHSTVINFDTTKKHKIYSLYAHKRENQFAVISK